MGQHLYVLVYLRPCFSDEIDKNLHKKQLVESLLWWRTFHWPPKFKKSLILCTCSHARCLSLQAKSLYNDQNECFRPCTLKWVMLPAALHKEKDRVFRTYAVRALLNLCYSLHRLTLWTLGNEPWRYPRYRQTVSVIERRCSSFSMWRYLYVLMIPSLCVPSPPKAASEKFIF